MVTFQVGKDFETSERAGAGGMFQVDTLIDEHGNNVTNKIDVGKHFYNNEDLAEYLSGIFGFPPDEFDFEDLE